MDIAPIKPRRDYHRILKEIERLMRAKRKTPEGERLDALVALVEAWERKSGVEEIPLVSRSGLHSPNSSR